VFDEKKEKHTQEVIQDDVNRSDENNDTSWHVKQVLRLEILPRDVIKPVRGQPQ